MEKYLKYIIIITTLLLSLFYKGQTIYEKMSNSTNSNTNLEIIPPSPESYMRSHFADISVNEFKGYPTVSIPLMEAKNSDLKVPITLKYTKAGVKVNDIPNITGVNWMIENGAIITRTIYGKADEKMTRNLINTSQLNAFLSDADALKNYYLNNNYEKEADVFNFTLPGYSGSFYLDNNFQPILMTNDHLCKIETIGDFASNFEFQITTNDGIKYFFGGDNYTESTFNKENSSLSGVTTFFLKRIQSMSTNNIIDYEYENYGLKKFTLSINETMGFSALKSIYCAGSNGYSGQPFQLDYNSLSITNAKLLKKIKYNQDEIIFNYDDSNLFKKLLNIQYSHNNKIINKYDFSYMDMQIKFPV